MTTRRQKTSRVGDATADDVAPRLTITVDVAEVIDLRSDPEESSLGQVISSEQALALRPQLEDPTRLTNGALHPRYAEWTVSRSWAEQHPLREYLTQPKYLDRLTDDRGYFDRKRVNRALGPSGSKSWLIDGPPPTKAKLPLLAELLGAPVEEVQAVVDQERAARDNYRSVVDRCRCMPYKLLTYEQVVAGIPCPGCRRPWVGPQDDLDRDDEQWRARHGDCHAGRNGYRDGPVHCLRCCGVPPLSPKQIETITRILQEAAARVDRERQQAAVVSPDVERQQAERAALKRAKRIEKLEAELQRLRDEEAAAQRQPGG